MEDSSPVKRINPSDPSSDYVNFPHNSTMKRNSNFGLGALNDNTVSISSFESPPFHQMSNNQRKRGQSIMILDKNALTRGARSSIEQNMMIQPQLR